MIKRIELGGNIIEGTAEGKSKNALLNQMMP